MEKNDADEAARMAKRITDKHLLRRNKEAKIVSYVFLCGGKIAYFDS